MIFRFRFAAGLVSLSLLVFAHSATARGGEDIPAFYRGLNLNGPPVVIDGNAWEGSDSKTYSSKDRAFENQEVSLKPATDADRAKMIRSSRWGGNRIELTNIPPGNYTFFLYVWEDNNNETYTVFLNEQQVLTNYQSGTTGHWKRLGPWFTRVGKEGTILLTSRGGAANFSGIELWSGHYDGLGLSISEDDLAFFEKRIRPLLVNKCYECHSAEADDLQGNLLVDSRATLQRGGDKGPAVVPWDLEQSLLIEAVRYANPDLQMPPDEKLSDAEIADLERWIKLGAPDPRSTATKHLGKQIDVDKAREFWSLRPIADPPVPKVKSQDWPATDIDRFILAKLEAVGLEPAAQAEKRVLLRRATYDLTGLPPTPEEVAEFLADDSPDAFSRVVNRLLDSPRYGERWGRHWLDVVRYADTAGDNSDYPIPQMYRYRDWVIDAFNRDLPYDEFVRDQLAGDLRGGTTEQQRIERIIATGYIANSRRFGSRVDDYPQHLTIEDTIDNLGRSFLGLTLSCTRCHDHKFDPITNRDYYALFGIFNSTRYPWPGIELDKRQRDFIPLVPPDRMEEMQQKVAQRQQQQSKLEDEIKKLKESVKQAKDGEKQQPEKKLKAAERRLQEHLEQPPVFETAYAVTDQPSPQDVAVQIKGDPAKTGDFVPRRFLTVLGGEEVPADCQTSGREHLAEWILADNNPLTARVIANRIWQYHFGTGIVPTSNNFGKQGKPPSHPELLDYLAVRFREGGWSIKAMHRMIMLSNTYQLSSQRTPAALASDPGNSLLSGFPRLRLEAEEIRDTLLADGGNLDLAPAGAHPFPPEHTWNFTQHRPFKEVYETNHRSVYLMTQRIQRHPFLAIFDGADPSTSTERRLVSTTPLQALYLLNDPFVHEQSRRVTERVVSSADNDEARVNFAYTLLLTRPATADEISDARQFLHDAAQLLQKPSELSYADRLEIWQAYVRTLFRLNEFVYID